MGMYMNGKFALVQVKAVEVINEFLPLPQEQWTEDTARQKAVIDPVGDNAATQANTHGLHDFIEY